MSRSFKLKRDESVYHVMCKSITEVNLFKDTEDKKKYLSLIKKYNSCRHPQFFVAIRKSLFIF
ncbi:hypothetical protein [Clostridium estertheticum]|uniref:hypothetical protein n=1 Tax=Clostridium estertheticum TaxID=238834 RepID=UPI001C0C062E|nr:hypothetical protein [Clostridium estertheticum]MBU3172248.1 hypothetical protein [Clostridium estertheticum]